MHTDNYLGVRFEVWNGRNRWFWRISDPGCFRAAVGVAANRAEAIGDARLSIEEIAARLVAEHPRIAAEGKSTLCNPLRCLSAGPAHDGWREMLMNLNCCLAQICAECG
jgi:hypothetical protein